MSSTGTKGGGTAGPPPLASHLLVAAALETWSHHLLYIRRVYPSSSFCDSYFLGIRCKANRHPGVVEYIRDAVQVAVPVLLGQTTASEFCLEVVDDLVPQQQQQDKDNPLLVDKKKKKEKHGSQENDEESEEDTPIDLPLHDDDDDDKSESDSEQQPQLGSIAQKLQELSTPSSSQEESARSNKRKRKKEEEEDSTDVSSSNTALKPAILFQGGRQHETNKKKYLHQTTTQQQSLSSLSQHDHPSQQQIMGNVEDEEQEDDEKATDPGYNIDSLTPDTEETARSCLQYKSLQVLERFSLHFSMPTTTTQEQQQTIVNVEDNRNNKKPRLGRFRPSAKKPTPKQTDPFQAVLPELERAFRNLILHLASLKRDRVLPSHTLSFKLLLLHTEEGHVAVLDRAFSVGSWYPASFETDKCIEERRPRLPLYQVGVGNSLLDIRFHMQRLQPDVGS